MNKKVGSFRSIFQRCAVFLNGVLDMAWTFMMGLMTKTERWRRVDISKQGETHRPGISECGESLAALGVRQFIAALI